MTRRFTMTGAALLLTMLASARGERGDEQDDALLQRILQAVEQDDPATGEGERDPHLAELEDELKA